MSDILEALTEGHNLAIRCGTEHGRYSSRQQFRYECECKDWGTWKRSKEASHEEWAKHLLSYATPEQIAELTREAKVATLILPGRPEHAIRGLT